MQVNVNLFRGTIIAKGYTQKQLSCEIGIDTSTFSRKLKSNALDFTIGEMHRIVSVLNLSREEACAIFLAE